MDSIERKVISLLHLCTAPEPRVHVYEDWMRSRSILVFSGCVQAQRWSLDFGMGYYHLVSIMCFSHLEGSISWNRQACRTYEQYDFFPDVAGMKLTIKWQKICSWPHVFWWQLPNAVEIWAILRGLLCIKYSPSVLKWANKMSGINPACRIWSKFFFPVNSLSEIES